MAGRAGPPCRGISRNATARACRRRHAGRVRCQRFWPRQRLASHGQRRLMEGPVGTGSCSGFPGDTGRLQAVRPGCGSRCRRVGSPGWQPRVGTVLVRVGEPVEGGQRDIGRLNGQVDSEMRKRAAPAGRTKLVGCRVVAKGRGSWREQLTDEAEQPRGPVGLCDGQEIAHRPAALFQTRPGDMAAAELERAAGELGHGRYRRGGDELGLHGRLRPCRQRGEWVESPPGSRKQGLHPRPRDPAAALAR